MAKKNKTLESSFFKVKQVCLSGLTLRMFEHDVADREISSSALIKEIIKEHYRQKPPIGFFTKGLKH